MALKDIFTIIKADRYTADGREELNKAIGNVTEDVKYNIGDISQKTGLQKTANGWVKPRSGKAPGAKTGEGKTEGKMIRSNVTTFNNLAKNGEVITQTKGGRTYDIVKIKGKPIAFYNHESKKVRVDENYLNSEPAESKPAEKKPALKLPDEKSSFATDVNRMKKLKKEDYKQYTIQLEKLHSKYPINKWKDLYNKTLNDAAPRQLTGDCKIRVRKH